MKKTTLLFSTLCFCFMLFTACEKEDGNISRPTLVDQLTEDYLTSFDQLVIDFKDSNEAVFKRGIKIDYSKLQQVESKQELVSTLKELGLNINPVVLQAAINSLENISVAANKDEIHSNDFKTLLSEKTESLLSLRSGSKIECLKSYDDDMATAALLTAGCAVVTGIGSAGAGIPGCIAFGIAEMAAAEISLSFCLKRVDNER